MKKSAYTRTAALLASLALVFAATVSATHAQSVKMTSLIRDINEGIPAHAKIINERCEGANPALEVDFASFGDNYEALENVPYQGLEQTAYGVGRFCTNSDRTSETDPVHVGALKRKVKKISIRFVPKAGQKKISLKPGGVVLIEMAFGVDYGTFGQVEIQEALKNIL